MEILRSIDIEDTVRKVLANYFTAYCRPLPKNYTLPCILVSQVGGSDTNRVDTFEVVLDSRAEDEATALLTLRNAVGILRQAEKSQNTPISNIKVNSSVCYRLCNTIDRNIVSRILNLGFQDVCKIIR